jgi:NAD(P)H-hydrate repair Nnr-like enzyme with NAD(P)H-hydrate dehydratase domain
MPYHDGEKIMLLIAGTIPMEDFPLTMGPALLDGDMLLIEGKKIPCGMGTAALISAAVETCRYLKIDAPHVLLAGDIGNAAGSKEIYARLTECLQELQPDIITLHYLQPIMGLMKKLVNASEQCEKKPQLIADAGSMYAAKAAGLAKHFTFFTPDYAEMKFLADPDATHPAYVSNYFIQAGENSADLLAQSVHKHGNSPKYILMKGVRDCFIEDGTITRIIDNPHVPGLEPIGGTGDTITGLLSALLAGGIEPAAAAEIAAKTNRMAGKRAEVQPDTSVRELISRIHEVFEQHFIEWNT